MADNCRAAREGTGHLLSLGHRNIMLLASEVGLRNIKERIEGYREALRESGISDPVNILVAGANETGFVKPALEQLLGNNPDPPPCSQ
jgi:DNA-binding LacI/PurR family transcriptional regulator